MQKISEKSCYYFYGKKWESWDQLRANFTWDIPDTMNAAFYVCDVHSEDKNKVAILHEDYRGKKGKITFWELKKFTNKFANYLKNMGLNQGDRVVICLSQRPENIISHIAVWKFGGVSVPLTILFGEDGLRFRLKHSGAKLAIVEDTVLNTLRSIKGQLKDLKETIVIGEAALEDNEVEFWSALMKCHIISALSYYIQMKICLLHTQGGRRVIPRESSTDIPLSFMCLAIMGHLVMQK